ncbi:hypothetical protein HDU81_005316 [Chytriomyces hyalinus]|nr:hypothetical protein HDU81_005316 [Chytriomyces hyalinus]
MATQLTPHQALCKKDAEGLADSYGRAVLDFPLLDGCNQEVMNDVDGWHDDCYLPSDAPWQFSSPNANYVNSHTMQTHCWNAHGIWLVNPGNPTVTQPIRVSQVPSLVPENPTIVVVAPTVETSVRTLSESSQPQIPSTAAQSLIPSNAGPTQGTVNENIAGQSPVTKVNGVVAPTTTSTSTASTNNAASNAGAQETPPTLSTPMLIVIVVGVCLFLALVVAGLLLWGCRKSRRTVHRISTSNSRHVKIQDSLDGDIPMDSTQYSGSTAGGTSDTASSARSPRLHRTQTEATSDHFSILNQDKPRHGQQPSTAEKDSRGFNSILNSSYSTRRPNRNGLKAKQEYKDFETEAPYLWTVDQTASWAARIPEIGEQVERLVRYHGITGEVLLQLRREDIKNELGLRLGPAIALEKEISQLMVVPECLREGQEYDQQVSNSTAPDKCAPAVFTALKSFYNECSDPSDFPFQFNSSNSRYKDPAQMVSFCFYTHGIQLDTLPTDSKPGVPVVDVPSAVVAPPAIAGITLGAGFAVGFFVVLLLVVWRRRGRRSLSSRRRFKFLIPFMNRNVSATSATARNEVYIPMYLSSVNENLSADSVNPNQVKMWSVDQVCHWARSIADVGSEMSSVLRYHSINGEELLNLTRSDMRAQLGLSISAAIILESSIEKLLGKG